MAVAMPASASALNFIGVSSSCRPNPNRPRRPKSAPKATFDRFPIAFRQAEKKRPAPFVLPESLPHSPFSTLYARKAQAPHPHSLPYFNVWSILPHGPKPRQNGACDDQGSSLQGRSDHVMANFDHSGSRSGFGSQRATVKWFNATKGF